MGTGALACAAVVWWGRSWLASATGALVSASPAWVALAVVAKAASMTGLAWGQRRVLAPGRHLAGRGLASATVTAYAGNTLSTAVPLAGAGLSAAYTYRRYVRAGVPSGQVATGLAVSWAVATSALTAILSAAAIASGRVSLLIGGLTGSTVCVAAVVGLLVAVQSPRGRRTVQAVVLPVLRLSQRLVRRPRGDVAELVARAFGQVADSSLRAVDVAVAVAAALLLWGADLTCLTCALAAIGATVSPPLLVLAWSAGVATTTFSITPGGLGIVEAALSAALAAVGLPVTTALTAVLLYRLVAFWLVNAVGAVLLASGRRARR